MLLARVLCAFLGAWLLPGTAFAAESYPQRPIRLIVPFAPGGAADIIGRLLGAKLGEALGQPIVIDIRPGAGSVLGTDLAAKANPDGYTLVLVATAHALNPGLMSKLPYDAIKDFSPITRVNRANTRSAAPRTRRKIPGSRCTSNAALRPTAAR